jgi:hypothetical protein
VTRTTTIGNPNDNLSSAIYFHGPHFSKDRITNLTKGKSGVMYKKAVVRKKWVRFMKERNKNRKHYTKEETKLLFDWISNTAIKNMDLSKIVANYRRKHIVQHTTI